MLLSIDVEFCSDDHLIDIFDQIVGWKFTTREEETSTPLPLSALHLARA
jgi:hypothetical protein